MAAAEGMAPAWMVTDGTGVVVVIIVVVVVEVVGEGVRLEWYYAVAHPIYLTLKGK